MIKTECRTRLTSRRHQTEKEKIENQNLRKISHRDGASLSFENLQAIMLSKAKLNRQPKH